MQKLLFTLLATTVATFTVTTDGQAQEGEVIENVQTFMRVKLMHSQNVLEGLTTEDFDKVAKSSQELSLLSLAAQWQVIQTPEYARRSAGFRREVEAMKAAADQKSLDGATLAYLKMTMNCIECHKYVRQVRQVRLEDLLRANRADDKANSGKPHSEKLEPYECGKVQRLHTLGG